jgi:LmbE family N-acetylglucosaminyl deacetylase
MQLLIKKAATFFLILLLLGLSVSTGRAQVRPVYDNGAIGLGQLIKRLQTTASAMHTGAHPDDEDSNLIAFLARGKNARTAYLSLNRGEGGQNVIGAEIFEPLGVIRTEELLQARRLDGGQQFFTSVMDYGFSKTRAEANKIWGEKETLGDMVRAIRTFRPLVVISRFSGTPADGHGQHQFAGYLTPLAYKAAADATQFPEQIIEGLLPWQAKKLYVGQGFSPAASGEPISVSVNTGDFDPLIGRSYAEIAAEGRSQHKSQEMGSIERRGSQSSNERLLDSTFKTAAKESDIFDGIDISIKGIAKLTDNSENGLAGRLSDLEDTAEKALKEYDAFAPQKIVPTLAKGVKQARDAKDATQNPYTKTLLAEKEQEFSKALQIAAGVVVDALSDTEVIVAGDATVVSVKIFGTAAKITNVALKMPTGWKAESVAEPKPTGNSFFSRPEVPANAAYFSVTAAAGTALTQPYWLEKPRINYRFDWSANDAVKNAPFQNPLVSADVTMEIEGIEVVVSKPVQYRYADAIRGELRRDLNVVPLVDVALDTNLLIVPASNKAQKQKLVVSVTNNAPRETKGSVKLDLPDGWTSNPASTDFNLRRRGEKTAVAFDITIPANTKVDEYDLTAMAEVNGQTFDQTMQEIAYPHIQTHRRYNKATVSTKVLDLKIAPVRVGYIMGSGDAVPAAIRRLGLNVTMLEEKDLSTGDLSKFDTIVVGIRASQVRPDYVSNNGRLLDFVKNGGTMIVQYQQAELIQNNLLPFPAKMEAVTNGNQRISNVRVTDENAPVKILVPTNPIFNYPNKIVNSDWDNWVQERNLYTLTALDSQYTALLETQDEGEPPVTGGLVYAKIGKGNYVYNAYSFFRQLPVGNPGAYRLFANMLSLPKATVKSASKTK